MKLTLLGTGGPRPDPDRHGPAAVVNIGDATCCSMGWAPPSKTVQVEYYDAVKEVTRAYLSTLSYADLETRRVIPPVTEPRSVAAALGQVTWDNVAHGGQIAYLRGLYEGMGWYTR